VQEASVLDVGVYVWSMLGRCRVDVGVEFVLSWVDLESVCLPVCLSVCLSLYASNTSRDNYKAARPGGLHEAIQFARPLASGVLELKQPSIF
jgi:hypothetical protein